MNRKALAVSAALALGSNPTLAQELKIGFIAPMTGIFAQIGKDMENGFQMYLDEQKGNFAGAKVTFIVEDGEGKPPVSVRKAEKLVRQDNVQMFVGGLLASLVAGDGIDLRPSGFVGSVIGAVIVLALWGWLAPEGAPARRR